MTLDESKEYGRQLSNPSGDDGLRIAELMQETNLNMTCTTADMIHINDDSKLLELGYANGGHLDNLLSRGKGISYVGLKISKDMQTEAIRRNEAMVDTGIASFNWYDGTSFPFEEGTFDRVMTVNTIYFWSSKTSICKEIARVLKPGGRVAIAFVQKAFMQKLPFTKQGFSLVNTNDVESALVAAGLTILNTTNHWEKVKTKSGEMVERGFSVTVAEKCLL